MTYLEIKTGMTVYMQDENNGEAMLEGKVVGLKNGTVTYKDKDGSEKTVEGVVERRYLDSFVLKDKNGTRTVDARWPKSCNGKARVELDDGSIVDMDPEMIFAVGSVVYMPGDFGPEGCRVLSVDGDGIWLDTDRGEYVASIDEICTREADV